MPASTLTIEQVLTVLAETPVQIAARCSGLTPSQLRTPQVVGEWSANDVLAHLRSCADVWGDCIARILAEATPTLRAIDPRSWIKRTNYPDLEFQPSLDAFSTQRVDLLVVLERLTPSDWSRTATVTGAGSPLVRTVSSYARRLARHERSHVKQFSAIVKSMHT
ncbi:MAG TPA: DinB family protein [Nitrolancea sp.]|nr:DinB family protein [Nitrolancea sp.]